MHLLPTRYRESRVLIQAGRSEHHCVVNPKPNIEAHSWEGSTNRVFADIGVAPSITKITTLWLQILFPSTGKRLMMFPGNSWVQKLPARLTRLLSHGINPFIHELQVWLKFPSQFSQVLQPSRVDKEYRPKRQWSPY